MRRENNFEGKSPLLYLVATPIGNRGELSPRASEILNQADFIACEDTRNSGSLFASIGIKKSLISCHEHNEEEAAEHIIKLLLEGKKVAYVSDAGYPGISDPGERLVARALANGIKVSVVNGPNAGLCALVASGLPTDHFYFEGFLPAKESLAKKRLESLQSLPVTMIFYEAPHRIAKTLNLLKETFGGNRKACLARELTKLHEEYIRGSLEELASLDPESLRGEMVIVVEGTQIEANKPSENEILVLLKERLKESRSKEAIAAVSKELGVPKNEVYDLYLKHLK